jgi:hypothetical protein
LCKEENILRTGLKKSAKSDTGDLTEENVGVDTGLTYDPKQLYMYKRKDDKNPSARQLDKDEFDHIIKDPKTILFKKTSEKDHNCCKRNKFVHQPVDQI